MFTDYAEKYSKIKFNDASQSAFMLKQLESGYCTIDWTLFQSKLASKTLFLEQTEAFLEEVANCYSATETLAYKKGPMGLFSAIGQDDAISKLGPDHPDSMAHVQRVMNDLGRKAKEEEDALRKKYNTISYYMVVSNEYDLLLNPTYSGWGTGEGPNDFLLVSEVGLPTCLSWLVTDYIYIESDSADAFHLTLRDAIVLAETRRPYYRTYYAPDRRKDVKVFIDRCFKDWDPEYCSIVQEALSEATTYTKPASFWDIARKDPKIAVWNLGWPFAIIGAITSGLMFLLPQHLLRYPCSWLGWPAPDNYENMIIQRDTIIEKEMSEILARNGIYENQIIKIE